MQAIEFKHSTFYHSHRYISRVSVRTSMISDMIIVVLLVTSGVSSQVMRWNSFSKRLTIIETPDSHIPAGALAAYPEVRVNDIKGILEINPSHPD